MLKRLLIVLTLASFSLPVFAFDFEVGQSGGYSLYFNIVDREENHVEVTYPSSSEVGYWNGYQMPSGMLSIPALIEYNGIGYVVVGVGDRAFSGCDAITGLYLPSTLTYIGAYAFNQCYGIQGGIVVGERVENIGKSAFYGCAGITSLMFNAVSCETMGGAMSSTAFGGCRSLTQLILGSRVKRIPDYAFYGMDQLVSEWNLPEGLEYIGEYAFAYCSKMRGSIVIPEGVDHVSPFAFAQCHGLNSVRLPEKLHRIDQRAFFQCVNLRNIVSTALQPPTVGDDAFTGIATGATLQVPCISEAKYRNSQYWNQFTPIKTYGSCNIDIVANLNNPSYGSIIGAGQYPIGTRVTLAAVCNAGYSFLGWSDGVNDNPRVVVADDTITYLALMQPNEVEYIHDTTYVDGVQVKYEYYEINDVAQPIGTQSVVQYNRDKQRLDIDLPKRSIVSVDLYNAAGQCISSGTPKSGHVDMKRFPSGNYMIRVTTLTQRHLLRFFHTKTK